MRRLGRVLLHSVLVGAIAGVVACAFFYVLEWGEWLLQGQLAHNHAPRPGGEVEITPPVGDGETRWWLLALLPALGGVVCGALVYRFAPEAAGPGGDAYIDAFHNKRGLVRRRVPLIKALASAVTISTGGSAGREGPVMQTSAGLGSLMAGWLRLNEHERRILVVAGAAAGTGAIFRTPLGAALYAVEVLYRDDFETDAIIPAVLGSVTAYSIFTTVFGQGHLFATEASYAFLPAALPLYAVSAVGLSLFGAMFVTLRDGLSQQVFKRIQRVPRWLLPAVGGAMLGLLSFAVPQALGTGYGWLQGAIEGAAWVAEDGYWLLWGLAAAKMLATSLTIASGGSGGEFGPSLVIGGLAGGGFGLAFHAIAPNLVPQPGAFALVGMGAMFGGVAHVPVSSLIMVCELCGSYDLLVPLMLAEGICFVLLRRVAIYPKQVPTRIQSPAHRDEAIVDVLESLRVKDVFTRGEMMASVSPGAPLRQVMRVLSSSEHPGVIVRAKDASVIGYVSLDALQGAILEEGLDGLLVAADVMHKTGQVILLDDDLHHVLTTFMVTHMNVLPVMDARGAAGQVVGVVSQVDVTRAYDAAVEARLLVGSRAESAA